ncbi:MAG: DNA replication complex subunit Gins51 [Candidatus Thorarchaeota archaeon]
MSNQDINSIQKAWEEENESEELRNLEDLRLSEMISYLSKLRLSLAETPAENQLQAELFTQEALNLEYMLKDLLILRREKILTSVLVRKKPLGIMVLAEEEFYNRILRGIDGHLEFIENSVVGTPISTTKRRKKTKPSKSGKTKSDTKASSDIEYIVVRFLRSVEEAFVGIDEVTYGPFQKEDVATIPTDNARIWLSDGTISRVVTNNLEAKE